MSKFYKPDLDRTNNLNVIIHTPRNYGRVGTYYFTTFRKAYAKERKKLMGELIIILSITLILTVLSSFWIGYSYGKLRAIKLYEETQIQTFKEYMNSTYGTTNMEGGTDNDSIN